MSTSTIAARGLLLDLDDTLYDYAPVDRVARDALAGAVSRDLGRPVEEVHARFAEARERVKARLGDRGSAHSRLLYLVEMVHAMGVPAAIGRVRGWERDFWKVFLSAATLRPFAKELLARFRKRGGKVAIVSDLIVEVQLWKLEEWGLASLVDAVVVSEEVPFDKPAPEAMRLGAARLGIPIEECVVVGDSDARDGGGARTLGIPYLRVRSTTHEGGMTLEQVGEALGLA